MPTSAFLTTPAGPGSLGLKTGLSSTAGLPQVALLHHHHDVGGSFSNGLKLKTQAVFVPLDFRLRSFDVRATVHIGRREKTGRSVHRSAGGADPVVKSPLRKWPSGPAFVFSSGRQMAVGA